MRLRGKAPGPFGCRKLGRAPHPPALGSPQNPAPPRLGSGVRGRHSGRLQATLTQTRAGDPGSPQRTPPAAPGAAGLPGLRGSRGSPATALRTRAFLHGGSRAPPRADTPANTRGRAHTEPDEASGAPWWPRPTALASPRGRSTTPCGLGAAVDLADGLGGRGGGRRWDWTLNLTCLQSSCRPVLVCMNKAILFPQTLLRHVNTGLQNYCIFQRMFGDWGCFPHLTSGPPCGRGLASTRAGPSSLAVPVSPRASLPASTSEARTGRARPHLLLAERVSLMMSLGRAHFSRSTLLCFLSPLSAFGQAASLQHTRGRGRDVRRPPPEAAANLSLPHP